MENVNSYKRIGAVKVAAKILESMSGKPPLTADELAKATATPKPTVLCHLETMQDLKWVREVNGAWEFGMGMALFYARTKAALESRRDVLNHMISTLEGA